jgi:outer membrane lipoprotein-sorting protein
VIQEQTKSELFMNANENEFKTRSEQFASNRVHSRSSPLPAAFVISALLVAASACGAQTNAVLRSWLDAQGSIRTWSADFLQTRTLTTLVQPLVSKGHVWFAAPNQFRWELGHPPETIAIRQTNVLYVIYPRLKRAERYPLTGSQPGPWRDTLALLDAGFPRKAAELESQYNVLSVTTQDDVGQVALQPQSLSARRMMPEITIAFSMKNYSLRATELRFADGATLRNDFTNAVLNPKIEPSEFKPNLPGDYKITEPLNAARQ